MPRNSTGTFTLVSGNPVVVDTLIDADWANTTMDDLATALTASLSRNGNGGMLAPLVLANGTVSLPAASFAADARTGPYLPVLGEYRIALNGVDAMRLTGANGLQVWDTTDSGWYSVTTTNTLGAFTETVTLEALQTVVPFEEYVAGASMYLTGASVDRGRLLLNTDYTYDSGLNEVTLTTSYAAGTKLTAVYQNETGALEAAAASSESAADSAASAAEAAATVALGAAGTTATSTVTLTVETGQVDITIETGKEFAAGHYVVVASTTDAATEYMIGTVTAYNTTTGVLGVNVTTAVGSAILASWSITLNTAGRSVVQDPMPAYSESTTEVTASGTTVELDLSTGNEFVVTMTAATQINFTGVLANGTEGFTVRFIDGDTYAPTLDANVTKWRGGEAAEISEPIYELGFKIYEGETVYTGYDIGAVAAP